MVLIVFSPSPHRFYPLPYLRVTLELLAMFYIIVVQDIPTKSSESRVDDYQSVIACKTN
jgi:hypothetical protein